jgi:hypothetical protein
MLRCHSPLSEMQRIGQPVLRRTRREKGPKFAMANNTEGPQYVQVADSPNTKPTTSESADNDRIVRLEQMVKLLRTELSNKKAILEERVTRLEQVNHARKAELRKRKVFCDQVSEIQDAQFAWSKLLGGRGATLTQTEDIPLGSDDKEENEEEVQVEHKQLRNGTQPLQATQPSCSKLYCTRKTIALKNGNWKQQCEHCLSLARKKTSRAVNSSLPVTTKAGPDSVDNCRIKG